MPVLSVVIPRLKTNQLKWSFTGAFEVCNRLSLLFAACFSTFHMCYVSNASNEHGTQYRSIYNNTSVCDIIC
jgi:pyruvate kinase